MSDVNVTDEDSLRHGMHVLCFDTKNLVGGKLIMSQLIFQISFVLHIRIIIQLYIYTCVYVIEWHELALSQIRSVLYSISVLILSVLLISIDYPTYEEWAFRLLN